MNRRGFLGMLGKAAAGAAVAYSFPSIIVPRNIITPDDPEFGRALAYHINDTGDFFRRSRNRFSTDELMAAHREYIEAVIKAAYDHDSDFLKRLERTVTPVNHRGRRPVFGTYLGV